MRYFEGSAIRPLDPKRAAAKQQQVEVHLARSPTLALLAPDRLLEPLQGDEQCHRARLGIRSRRHVEGDDGIQEVRLVEDANRSRDIQRRHAEEVNAW